MGGLMRGGGGGGGTNFARFAAITARIQRQKPADDVSSQQLQKRSPIGSPPAAPEERRQLGKTFLENKPAVEERQRVRNVAGAAGTIGGTFLGSSGKKLGA